VRISPQWKIREINESGVAALAVDLAIRGIAADNLRDLDVDQMRGVQRLARAEQPRFHRPCRRCTQERFEQSRSIDDDHRRSRSARTA